MHELGVGKAAGVGVAEQVGDLIEEGQVVFDELFEAGLAYLVKI